MADIYFMKEPCKHCPFRRDVTPFLTPERGEQLAYHTCNPYNTFTCHKTTKSDDDSGDTYCDENSLECAGFLSMQLNQSGDDWPEGFTPSDKVYEDCYEMADAYADPEINPNAK